MTVVEQQDIDIQLSLSYEDIVSRDIAYDVMQLGLHKNSFVRMDLTDMSVVMPLRDALFNLLMWRPYSAFGLPIISHYVIDRISISDSAIANEFTKQLRHIRTLIPGDIRSELNDAFYRCVEYMYNFVVTELNDQLGTIDIVGIANLMNHVKVKQVRTIDAPKIHSTDVMEKKISGATKQLIKLLSDPNEIPPEDNCLLYFMQTRQINLNQLPQLMIAYGPRTDVDDKIILYTIMDSSIEGITSAASFVVESLSAKKSLFYNQVAVSDSQYFARKQHLLASALYRIYPEDCGSTQFLKTTIKPEISENYLGVFCKMGPNEPMFQINELNIREYEGATVYIRNPLGCRHRDGACIVCGGELFQNIDPHTLLGMLSAGHIVSQVTQKILSNKHLTKTNTQLYMVPKELQKIMLRVDTKEIQWSTEFCKKLDHMTLGIPLAAINSLHDIMSMDPESKNLRVEKFSRITTIVLRNEKTKAHATFNLVSEGITPFLSVAMLEHVRDFLGTNPDMSDGMLWVPLADTNKLSVFETLVVNDSMVKFVSTIVTFCSQTLSRHTDANEAFDDFCTLIFTKVSTAHVSHIGVLLKAYMVTDNYDYRIPVVEDIGNVTFGKLDQILKRRALSTHLAYQGITKLTTEATSALIPTAGSFQDAFFGL